MAELTNRERLQPALLDRLTDNAPDRVQESSDQQVLQLHQLRQSVLRDLAWLLNTARLDTVEDLSSAPLAAKSTINYGVPGFSGVSATAGTVASLERSIADAIRTFEPRIRSETLRVRLRPAEGDDPMPNLVFEIQGELWARPVPLQLFLETSFDLESHAAIVTEARARG